MILIILYASKNLFSNIYFSISLYIVNFSNIKDTQFVLSFIQISASSLTYGRASLLRDQLNVLLTQTATLSNMYKTTLKHVVANVSELIENVISPMNKKKVRNFYFLFL